MLSDIVYGLRYIASYQVHTFALCFIRRQLAQMQEHQVIVLHIHHGDNLKPHTEMDIAK